MALNCLLLFYSFFKIGVLGFGGGYAMISMLMVECEKYSISAEQFADLNALHMIIPGPLAINAATYVGFLNSGFWGAVSATAGVCAPSFILVALVMHFISKYRDSSALNGILSGVRPAAVGLIAAATVTIAGGVLLRPGMVASAIFSDPFGAVSVTAVCVFAAAAVANIRFKVNPILLTVLAGALGAFLYRFL